MGTWNLKELRELVKPNLNEDQMKEAILLMDSFDWKNRATYYHLLEADEAIKEYASNGEDGILDVTRLLLSNDSSSQEFKLAKTIREFSLVAATTTVHTLPEVLAQIVDLLIIRGNRNVHSVSLKRTISQLGAGSLKDSFNELTNLSEYAYINAFTNTAKHISMVRSHYSINFEPDSYHGVVFKEYSYKGELYQKKRDVELIKTVKTIRSKCIEIGNQINNELR